MTTTATAVYEIVVHETTGRTSWVHSLFSFFGRSDTSPSGVIISVLHRETGDELFRHIEESGDDEDHLLTGLRQDLASMNAVEFAHRWG